MVVIRAWVVVGITTFSIPVSARAQASVDRLQAVPGGGLALEARAGATYQLQWAPRLSSPAEWQDVEGPRTPAVAGLLTWPWTPSESPKFFRVRISGDPAGLTREAAEARVISDIIRPAGPMQLILGLRGPLEALAPGTVLRPISREEDSPAQWQVEEPSYLFVLDHAPSQKLGHPFSYVLVGKHSGAVRILNAFSPPEVDGVPYLATLRERWKSEARFYPAAFTGEEPPLAAALQLTFPEPVPDPESPGPSTPAGGIPPRADAGNPGRPVVDCTTSPGRKVAVVIASGADEEIQNDARDMGALLARLGFTVTSFNSVSNSVTEVATGLQAAGQGLGPCDKFFVYLSSHTQLVDDNDDGKPDDLPFRLDFGLGHATKTTWSWLLRHPNSLTSILRTNLAGRINLMLDTCFSEALALRLARDRFQPPAGVEWNIYASSAADRTSAGATELDFLLDYDNDDVNSKYTERILALVTAAQDAGQVDQNGDGQLSVDEIEGAFAAAQTMVANELSGAQMPGFHQFHGPVPNARADNLLLPPGRPTVFQVGANDLAVPGTQFLLTEPPPLHPDLFHWNAATGEMTLTGLTTVPQVSYRYRLVAGNLQTDPVLVTVQFEPRRNYAEEFLQVSPESDKVAAPCVVLDGLHYPIYQFVLANNPADVCKEPHWHAHRTVYPVDSRNASGRNDPNPPACGFGTVKQLPVVMVEVSKDDWAQFLIDHLPPLP